MRLFQSHPSLIGIVQDHPLNIYTNRDDREPPLTVLPVGAEIELEDTHDDPDGKRYTKIRMPSGHWGYITGDAMLTLIIPISPLDDADMHLEPSASSPTKAHYKRGSQLWMWPPEKGWTKVRDREANEGYVPTQVHVHVSTTVEKLAQHYSSGDYGTTISAVVQHEPLKVYRMADDTQVPLAALDIGTEVKVVLGLVEHGGKKYLKLKMPSGQEGWVNPIPHGTCNLFAVRPLVLMDDADMYVEPSSSSPVKAHYTKGTVLFLLPTDNKDWVKVRDYHGSEGYVPETVHVKATAEDMENVARLRKQAAGPAQN